MARHIHNAKKDNKDHLYGLSEQDQISLMEVITKEVGSAYTNVSYAADINIDKFVKPPPPLDDDDFEPELAPPASDNYILPPISSNESAKPITELVEQELNDYVTGIAMSNSQLCILQGVRAIIRADHHTNMTDKVKILSGGRASLDPLFAGFVGTGMLTAAVLGDKRNCPSVRDILKVILELSHNHSAGILIIILNSFETAVNFGSAMEDARRRNIKIDMVSVGDNCWHVVDNKFGRRGLAGAIILFKIAGAMSESGKTMKEIYGSLQSLAHLNIATISMTFDNGDAVIGTDFMNQTGKRLVGKKLKDIVDEMVVLLVDTRGYFSMRIEHDASIVVLMNTYCCDRVLMFSALTHVVNNLNSRNIPVRRVYSGNFISGRKGFSITLFRDYGDHMIFWLDYPTSTPYWPRTSGSGVEHIIKPFPVQDPSKTHGVGPKLNTDLVVCLSKLICRTLIRNSDNLDSFDKAFCYGSTLAYTAKEFIRMRAEDEIKVERAYNFFVHISELVQGTMRGQIGSLFGCFILGVAQGFLKGSSHSSITLNMWRDAVLRGINLCEAFGNVRPGDGTFLDGFNALVEAFTEMLTTNNPAIFDWTKVIHHIEKATQTTKGKSNYLKSKNSYSVGCVALTLVLQQLTPYIDLKKEVRSPTVRVSLEAKSEDERESTKSTFEKKNESPTGSTTQNRPESEEDFDYEEYEDEDECDECEFDTEDEDSLKVDAYTQDVIDEMLADELLAAGAVTEDDEEPKDEAQSEEEKPAEEAVDAEADE